VTPLRRAAIPARRLSVIAPATARGPYAPAASAQRRMAYRNQLSPYGT
jgi:hypothetical protein